MKEFKDSEVRFPTIPPQRTPNTHLPSPKMVRNIILIYKTSRNKLTEAEFWDKINNDWKGIEKKLL